MEIGFRARVGEGSYPQDLKPVEVHFLPDQRSTKVAVFIWMLAGPEQCSEPTS